jgi:DDE_Tnp_1-associated/Transposase DDE domain
MSASTLYEALATMPDPRSRHGRVHPLPAVLGLVVLAMLMGRTSLVGIARFGRQHGTPLAHALGFTRGKTPSVSTLSRTLRRFEVAQLEAILTLWLTGRIDLDAIQHISLDGKVLRGSRDGELPGQHLVAAYAPSVTAVLAQIRVDSKTNEHKAALELLGLIPVRGKVVVGDAMFCQRDLAEKVVDGGGDYVFVAKGNQSGLKTDIHAGFGFEAAARAIAAATSPSGPAVAHRAGSGSHHGEQRPRSHRETHLANDLVADVARQMEGHETRL